MLGLGNPGPRYAETRHNVGFAVLETLARRRGFVFHRPFFRPLRYATTTGALASIVCVEPLTYMNRSGTVVPRLLQRFSLTPERMIVVVDNLDLPCGAVRLKRSGGTSTHNGLRSLGTVLGTFAFPRLYVGIGRPAPDTSVIEHVLGAFTAGERPLVDRAIERAATGVERLGEDELDKVLEWINTG